MRDAAQAQVDGVRGAVGAAAAAGVRAHEEAQHAARARAEHTEKTLAAARGRWERFVPEDSWLTDDSARELAAPWSDPEITAARSELFLAALHLHQAFLRCTARTMYANLMAGMDAVMRRGAEDRAGGACEWAGAVGQPPAGTDGAAEVLQPDGLFPPAG